MPHERACRSVVQVSRARGFVVEGSDGERYVLTASHCLPFVPPPFPDTQDCIYTALLGSVGAPEPLIWAECRFVDPVSDIAVLARPDDQVLFAEVNAYATFIADTEPMS